MQNKQVYDELFDSAYVKVVTTEFFLSFMLIDDIPNTPKFLNKYNKYQYKYVKCINLVTMSSSS